MSVDLIEVHHLAMIPVSHEDDIFALRDRIREANYEIDSISEPKINFPDFAGTTDTLGGPWRNVDIVTISPRTTQNDVQAMGKDLLGENYGGSLILEVATA